MRTTALLSAAVSAAIAIACSASADVIYSSEAWEDQAATNLPATANNTDYIQTSTTGDGTTVKVVGNLDDGNPGTTDPTGKHIRVAGDVNKHVTLASPMTLDTDSVAKLKIDFAIYFDKGGYSLAQNAFELLYSATGDFSDAVVVQKFTTVNSGPVSGPFEYVQKTWYPGQSVTIYASTPGITFTDTAKLRWRKGVGSSGSNSYVYLDDVVITSVPRDLITYVDAVEGASGNTFATGGSLADTSWLEDPGTSSANETQWGKRTTVEGNGSTVFQAFHEVVTSNDMPELTTRIDGLADGTYRVWAFYWDQVVDNNQNWTISTGLNSGSLFSYSSPGEPAVTGTTSANVTNAANLSFTNTNSVQVEAGFDGSVYVRNLFGVYLGEVTVSGGAGTIDVFVDNLIGNDASNRTWYDGVGYQLVSTSSDPRITSFSAVGSGVWELTLQGNAFTDYEFRSSTTLEFTPGTLLGLTQENPASDPGDVDVSGDFLTTDVTGAAKVRLMLTGPTRDFVRAQTTP